MSAFMDMSNKIFGRLTVISRLPNKNGQAIWLCKCECGNVREISGVRLRYEPPKSCGCVRVIHGKRNTRLSRIWRGIIQRCTNNKMPNYQNYGGRGITICSEWQTDFTSFYNWAMANGYQDNLTIDRIEVNGNYEPNNCRWATGTEQANNMTSNHTLSYNGETHTIAEWSKITGVNRTTIQYRIKQGFSVEKALSINNKRTEWQKKNTDN